jgi:hypothetical protein
MSELSSSETGKAGKPKKPVSPARNAIGLIVLLALLVVGGLQYWAFIGHNSAVKALESRAKDEDKGLLSVEETETLIGKSPDGPGTDVQEGGQNFTKKTYTWRGIKPYTLTVFYLKGSDPRMHHFETEGAKVTEENEGPASGGSSPGTAPPPATANPAPAKGPAPPAAEGESLKTMPPPVPAKTSTEPAAEAPSPKAAPPPVPAKKPE